MGHQVTGSEALSVLTRYTLVLAAGWTLVAAGSLALNLRHEEKEIEEVAQTQARTAYEKDVFYRRWNAELGGVYACVSDRVAPNPYLKVPERDIVAQSGQVFTLINPEYMNRQVDELMVAEHGLRGHISSLRPMRPENGPDLWEMKALNAFERGEEEVASIENLDGHPYMRLMRPLVTEQSCLHCHAEQGYKVGDIRGGISVAVPMTPLWAIQQGHTRALWLGHGGLWAFGLVSLFAGSRLVKRQMRGRFIAEEMVAVQSTALEKAANAIMITDRNGVIQYVNPAFTTLTGYTADEAVGRTPRVLKSNKHGPRFYQALWWLILSGSVWQGEITNRRKDGSLYLEEMTVTPVKSKRGKIEHFIAVKQDISGRKEAEYQFRARGEELALPHLISQVIGHANTIEAVLDGALAVLSSLQECGEEGKAVAFLVDEDAKSLRLVKTRGHFGPEFLEAEAVVPLGICLCGRAAQSGEVLVCDNCMEDPRHEHRWVGMKAHGHYIVPLMAAGHVLGVVTLYTSTPPHTDTRRIQLLKQIGDMLGAAIDRLQVQAKR